MWTHLKIELINVQFFRKLYEILLKLTYLIYSIVLQSKKGTLDIEVDFKILHQR